MRQPSNLRGWWCVLCQWGLTIALFGLAAAFPNPLVILLCVILLGGRALGFFVLTHECGHQTLFASRKLNRFVQTWLTSPVDFSNGQAYMREHLEHHRAVGQQTDPDLGNYADYPISRERLKRKLFRDITGQTGARDLKRKLSPLLRLQACSVEDRNALLRGVAMNVLMLLIMTAVGAPWLYLLWLAALVFTFPIIARLRQVAEHASVPQLASKDARLNTRTVLTNPFTRLLLCPHQVNYHIEHHLLPSVPIYRLPALHALLAAQGVYKGAAVTPGYVRMLREVTT